MNKYTSEEVEAKRKTCVIIKNALAQGIGLSDIEGDESNTRCRGYCYSEENDEPIDACKRCKYNNHND